MLRSPRFTRTVVSCFATALGLLLLAANPVAAVGPQAAGQNAGKPNRPDRAELREKLLEKFDQDGDGKLNEDERATARKAREERQGGQGKGGPGKGGAGRGKGAPGKPGNRAEMRQQLLEKFDVDGDGKLSQSERAAAREAFREKRAAGKNAGPGQNGRKGPQAGRGRKPGAGAGRGRLRGSQQGKRPGNQQRGPRANGKGRN